MGRSLSPMLRRELENLEKDADSRKIAMKALKSYVKELDPKSIPMFLAHVSKSKQTRISSGEYTISLYEVLARGHGQKIVPQIDNIMTTIVKTLSSSAGSFALHQACSKVVSAIARYAIEPTTAEDKKRFVIYALCQPLSDSLLDIKENLSSGAALCLQALIESDNWRFATNEMVNEVCQRVAGALEKHLQTNSHLALVMALAKNSSLIVEAYARLLVKSGMKILDVGFTEENSQKQLSAIHMVSSLMRCLDPKSVSFEMEFVIKELEKCQSDRNRMPFVTGAAYEALQIAKRIYSEKDPKFERVMGSASDSNFERRENARRIVGGFGEQSPYAASPESQTVDSIVGYDYLVESPISIQNHHGMHRDRGSVNRKLWQRCENGAVDVSLKDGILSGVSQRNIPHSEYDEFSDNCGDHGDTFSGFRHGNTGCAVVRSTTPSPQRSNSHINLDNVKIFSTPRKLIRSLQDSNGLPSGKEQTGRFRTSTPSTLKWTPASKHGQNDFSRDMNQTINGADKLSSGGEHLQYGSESVSSTEDVIPDTDIQVSPEMINGNRVQIQTDDQHNDYKYFGLKIICCVFVLFAASFSLLAIGDEINHSTLVPT